MADTVALMKQRVLDMAIRGELVEQRPEERVVTNNCDYLGKEFKNNSNLHELPKNWSWTTLDHITDGETLKNGDWILSKNMSENEEVKLIQLGSIGYGKFVDKIYKHISFQTFKELNCTEITTGDLLINRLIGDKMFVTLLPEIEGKKITSVDVCVIKPNREIYDLQYIKYIIMSSFFQRQVMSKSSGTTRKRISKNNLVKLFIPFPPLAEQKRIVAKIEEIFAVIDQIGTKKEEALSIIRNIRQTALQDAIRGVLVEQDDNDEPASILYEKIQAEKEKLVKEKKMKKEKPLPEIETDKVPFGIPDKWKWVRLSDIGSIIGGGTPKTSVDAYWEGGTIPWVSPADLTGYKERTISEGRKNITELGLSKSSARLMPAGTVLFSSRAPIGYVVIAENPISTNQGFKSVVPYIMDMNHYIYYYFFAFVDDIKSRSSGTTFKEISGSELGKSFFPMPPLSEQQRIVEKLDEIMAICDQMESILDGSSETNKALKVAE